MTSDLVQVIGYGILGGIVAVILPRLLLCIIGFTCCGVRKDSTASEWHSLIGNAQSGSCFSGFQSTGAGGCPCGVNIGLFLMGFLLVVILMLWDYYGKLNIINFTNSTA